MASETVTPPQVGDVERELHIEIWRDEFFDFEGTALQLEAEGLIPQGFEWPSGRDSKNWEANGFDCSMHRSRPAGHKGPMSSWLELDNWCIRVRVTGRDFFWRERQQLARKAEELRADYYRLTAAGSREWDKKWSRHYATLKDEAFQAFKAKVPGLIPPKRGRKRAAA